MFRCILMLALGFVSCVFAQNEPPGPAPLKFPFEESNAIVKFDCTSVNVAADGKSTALRHYRVAVLSDRAIRQ